MTPIMCPLGIRAVKAIIGVTAIYKNKVLREICIKVCIAEVTENPGKPTINSAAIVKAVLTIPKKRTGNRKQSVFHQTTQGRK